MGVFCHYRRRPPNLAWDAQLEFMSSFLPSFLLAIVVVFLNIVLGFNDVRVFVFVVVGVVYGDGPWTWMAQLKKVG